MRKLSVLFALFLILSGCSGKPSDNDIEKQIVGYLLSDGGNEIVQVENFEKINGFKKGLKTYVADIKYDLVFKKGIKELTQQLKNESQGTPLGAMEARLAIEMLQMQFGSFEAGHRILKDEKVTFIKTENGWQISE